MKKTITFSTWLTVLRIILAPFVMVAMYFQAWFVAVIIFSIASITDFFDGYCARLYQQETQLGKILDPVADKILLFSTLLMLYYVSVGQLIIPLWFIVVVLGKDFILMLGVCYLWIQKKYIIINPSLLAKCTTTGLMLFIVYIMLILYGIVSADYVVACMQFLTVCIVGIIIDYGYKFYRLISSE